MENNCPECQRIEDDKRCVELFKVALEKRIYDLMVRTPESQEAKQVAQEELNEFITTHPMVWTEVSERLHSCLEEP